MVSVVVVGAELVVKTMALMVGSRLGLWDYGVRVVSYWIIGVVGLGLLGYGVKVRGVLRF